MAPADPQADLLRRALDSLVLSAGVCRVVRADDGSAVDLEFVDSLIGPREWRGHPTADLRGRRYTQVFPSGVADRLPRFLAAIDAAEPCAMLVDVQRPDGRRVVAEAGVVPTGVDEVVVTLRDVSAERDQAAVADRARTEALATRDLLTAALDSAPEPYALFDVSRRGDVVTAMTVVLVNEAAAAPTGRTPDSWAGADIREWVPESGARGLYPHLCAAAEALVPVDVRVAGTASTGWVGEFDYRITPVGTDHLVTTWRPAGDAPTGAVSMSQTPVVRRDVLTGLSNRGEFRRRLGEYLRERRPGDPPAAVYVVDIDDFGRINDAAGTQRGDVALVSIAAQLRALGPWVALPARLGADEFAFVITDVAIANVAATGEHGLRILRVAAAEAGLPPMTASAGVRILEPGLTVDEILRDCDVALRFSVRAGGGQLTVFRPDIRRRLLADHLRAEDIRRGLQAGEFRLAFQPIVRVETREHLADEALARWEHPEHGTVPPDRFIPVAEATGVIADLGSWIIDEAIRCVAAVPGRRGVHINVSGAQLLSTDVPATVAAAMERHWVSAARVTVELTESAIVPQSRRIRDQLVQLQAMGVQVAVDDFGSGYSSIAYLDWIPVDVVKLDQQFLAGTLDRRRRALIAATAQLIRSIGARSVAEGIESAEQFAAVREAGIDQAQGYLFGRPTLWSTPPRVTRTH